MTVSDGIERNDSKETIKNFYQDFESAKTKRLDATQKTNFAFKLLDILPTKRELKQYIGVILFGITLWATSWFVFQEAVLPGSSIFNLAAMVAVGYVFGHTLERYTTINAMAGMTLVGALFKIFGQTNFIDNPVTNTIDYHLRRIYPVLILTKGPLGWNWPYIKNNSMKVFLLATLPWIVECLSTAIFTHVLLEYPWYWGVHLGAILSSVSPAVVVPTVMAFSAKGLGTKNKIALLVANAGGLDTAFTEGMFGVINSAIFYPSPPAYRIVKALLAIFVGIGLGIGWGILCDILPDHKDPFAATVRSLLIFAGGLLLTYAGGYLGWGGTSGVAIMVCAGTAATRWARRDWPINDNPVATVYKVLWLIFEPMLFTLSGYFLEVTELTLKELGLIVACLFLALIMRLVAAFLISILNRLSIKESLFIAVTWIPKAIVEAVLVRVATDSLWKDGATEQDKKIAKQHANIIIIAILIMTSLGSGLTTILGPVLLSQDFKIRDSEFHQTPSPIQSQVYDVTRRKNTNTSVHFMDE
ncbi:PREDICTED: sodium/hydrogen exchanger 9B1-like [Papilio xuthus]|uniref:Sodium/hydrogen exchanger 9B1-like n=1 Tax=Papilio xuthus TaxID=66420 RepID=A0AAJ6ZXI6_PAPXU|nr:PREDICTED: sodium/hydrogen exchanger 9B1-like [Papilio xuthus]